MSTSAFLLYRPVIDYEDSIEPRLIFSTLEKAEETKAEIIREIDEFLDSLPKWPDDCCSFDERYEHPAWALREAAIRQRNKTPSLWVFGMWDLSTETEKINPGCIEIMELPLNPARAQATTDPTK